MAELITAIPFLYALSAASAVAFAPTSFLTTDRPVHLAVLTLICTSILLSVASRLPRLAGSTHPYSRVQHESAHESAQYESVALQDTQLGESSPEQETQKSSANGSSKTTLFLVIICGTTALTLRIEILRRILLGPECTSRSRHVWLPFLVAVYDAVITGRLDYCDDRTTTRSLITRCLVTRSPSTNAYPDFTRSLRTLILSSPLRYAPAALLLSFGCHLVTGLWRGLMSTRICPLANSDASIVGTLQWISLFFDAGLVISAMELGHERGLPSGPLRSIAIPWVIVTTLAATIWVIVFGFVYRLQPENHAWLVLSLEASRFTHVFYLLSQARFLISFCVATLYSITHTGLVDTAMVLTTVFVMVPGLRFIWSATYPYLVPSSLNATWSFLIMYGSWLLFIRTRKVVPQAGLTCSLLPQLAVFMVLMGFLYPGIVRTDTTDRHPIDGLLQTAHAAHAAYLKYASQSTSLADAARVYQERYRDVPPPGFDIWFEFAKNRSVLVIDEFDQIHRDLLPFRAFSPAQLRVRTWEMIADNSSGVNAIKIREGKAIIHDGVAPTHRWMFEGVVRILETFSQYLPDMDIGFSLSDECRVAVPFAELQELQNQASQITFRGTSTTTSNRTHDWREIPEETVNSEALEDWSLRNIFQEWIAATCPPTSAARGRDIPLYKSQLCHSCTIDHSLGQFLSNWTMSADLCHQPDLATAHGFLLSPAVFRSTRRLYPIFSQSKIGGFNDIIYPSAWNYVDKVIYAPTDAAENDRPAFPDIPFGEKTASLFWRGGTTEGISDGHGAWRGMVRQRMVHLTNNFTTSQHESTDILLPNHGDPDTYTYTAISRSSFPTLGLNADVRFVDHIDRCGGRDCDEQRKEFGLVGPVDFQSHWKFKFLVDLDGAAFSGRFIPFLQSRSLPFKSGLFREWYNSRLTAWLHFVPVDIRLHGLWSTLAYFSGVRGNDENGRTWNWAGHDDAAQRIAEAGREWSNQALTKQDMEVYFFRLLLEWARLTDDRRLDLGFSVS